MLASICFLLSHPNPVNHSTAFVRAYEKKNIPCTVYTQDEAVAKKFDSTLAQIEIIDTNESEWAVKLGEKISAHDVVIADVSTPAWQTVYDVLAKSSSATLRAVYYDNPEIQVTGVYSNQAEKMIKASEMVIFASSTHVESGVLNGSGQLIDLRGKKLVGLGFYDASIAAKIQALHRNQDFKQSLRVSLFKEGGIKDKDQNIIVYTGGANPDYYNNDFPLFLKLLEEAAKEEHSPLADSVIVLQQHPRSVNCDGNIDGIALKKLMSLPQFKAINCSLLISSLKIEEVLSLATCVCYAQTSMSPQFILGKIPQVVRVTHSENLDVTSISATKNIESFNRALSSWAKQVKADEIKAKLGIVENWETNLPFYNI